LNSPPRIVSAVINPPVVATDEQMTVFVDWTGSPKMGERYQWRQGTALMRGEIGQSYTPNGTEVAVNCVVTIDNGYGAAIAIALPAERPDAPADEGGNDEFSDDFSDEFA
jgi:hypothetical protein